MIFKYESYPSGYSIKAGSIEWVWYPKYKWSDDMIISIVELLNHSYKEGYYNGQHKL